MPNQPMAEVFGFQIDDLSPEAQRYRQHRLCPFNNKVPSCTKDKASDPLGVCSVYAGNEVTITCPIRFREDWRIASDAAEFFFPPGVAWTSFTEVPVENFGGKNDDTLNMVLSSIDQAGTLTGMGALEVQAVNISGNIREAFAAYLADPQANRQPHLGGKAQYPQADFQATLRQELVPLLMQKGSDVFSWQQKMVIAVDKAFFAELAHLPKTSREEANIAWLVYDLIEEPPNRRYRLQHIQTVYTEYAETVLRLAVSHDEFGGPAPKLRRRKLVKEQSTATRGAKYTATEIMLDPDSMVVDED